MKLWLIPLYHSCSTRADSLDWTDYVLSFDMKSADNDGIGALVRYRVRINIIDSSWSKIAEIMDSSVALRSS